MEEGKAMLIPVEKVQPHPLNPRCNFGGVSELAENIREHGGHPLIPITVRPLSDGYYQIICGHTRYRALRDILGYRQLEVGKDLVIRELDDMVAIRFMVDENIKRVQYKPAEFVEALKLLIDSCGMSIRQVAEQYNVSASWLDDILSISKLPDRVKAKVEWGKGKVVDSLVPSNQEHPDRGGVITVSHAKQITRLDSHEEQTKAALAVEKFSLTSAETREVVGSLKRNPWASVDDLVRAVRNGPSSTALNSLTVEVADTRVAKALSEAARSTGRTPEEYASEKIIDGLVNDGYLSPDVMKQDDYRRWMENEILASQA